ncbi:sushi, von Willebrand factor type A, EGF and pentraxin domain-containing protein 1-like, partial [Limulus polyphemus]|uniref:Sushi, von Willebrand factor type A, EGF and pentraxin domain-containing protein 1-like n=1 Tax=Limulus polyphemus TaxID=6850 RepID=A0ABM1TQE6_LIMPO
IQEGPLLCSRPNDPINGKTVCEKLRHDGKYPTGATCRYFCNPGYELSGSVSNTPVMVCRGPEWKVYKGVSCASNHCSEPTIPNNGHLECPTYSTGSPQSGISANNKLTYARGIICHYRCYRGYTIPSIQRNKTVIQCIGPYWNSTVYPQCKATPKPINCTDQALVAEGGVTEVKTPRFVAGDGTDLDVECVIQGELEPGEYNNTCKATDPDLGTTVECTYKIRVKGMACTSPPQIDHGSFNCIPGKFGELTPGSICNYHCDEGYVTPLSQSELITWICLSNVQWNITDKPTCLRIVPPKPVNCTDQILVAENGFAEVNKPRFIAANGKELDVECTLMKPLKLGNHSNICESTDSELQASARCTYGIQVIAPKCEQLPSVEYGFPSCVPGTFGEFTPGAVCTYKCENGFVIPASQSDIVARICLSSSRWNVTKFPECWKLDPPKPVNCINQTVVAKNGVVKVTKPRFVAGDGRELDVICSLEGLLEPGEHWNFCHAFDPELMTGDICIYNISVKVPTCDPPPQPEYGYVECNITESDEYPIGTTCYYSCLSDYVIPKSQSNLRTRVCLDLLQWNITSLPECKKKIVPYPKKGTCNDEIFETNDPSSITLDPPTFVRAQGDAAVVNCSLTIINSYGIHENFCRATDPELQTSTSCTYKIEVKDLEQSDSAIRLGCDPLSAPANGYIQCRAVQNTFWCNIKCKSGFSMPSNFHLLQEGYVKCDPLHGLWNFQRIYRIQRLPDCLAESPRTMIEGSIKFKTDVRDCSDYDNVSFLTDVIKKGLLGRNQEICGQIDCNEL